ncbi:MAG: glycosyltransferase [Candidatus Pacebacteria bacterium]|nr:glycosyltransferase [Candidatus Paceibacterota bacterium]
MRIAFVHEYLNQFGGAERTLSVLSEMFPSAPIYTLIYSEQATKGLFKDRNIKTSFLQKFPNAVSHHEWYPMLMPLAMEQFDFSEYDVIISVSASFAKGVITKPTTRHICYCLTPPRFLWDNSQKFSKDFGFPFIIKLVSQPLISYLRMWDQSAADRVDEFWKISNFVGRRIEKYYHKKAHLIYPPVDISKFPLAQEYPRDYFLMAGRLVSYKKFDVAVRAFNKLGLPLKIIGTGPELKKLKKMSSPNVQFLGQVSDEKLGEYYRGAKALIFPQEEDFGIVPLEAMASGRPVISYRGGGAEETIAENKTGIFFDQQTPESIIEAVKSFSSKKFDPSECRAQAEKFSIEVFKDAILSAINLKP